MAVKRKEKKNNLCKINIDEEHAQYISNYSDFNTQLFFTFVLVVVVVSVFFFSRVF